MAKIHFSGAIDHGKDRIERLVDEVLKSFKEQRKSLEIWFATPLEIKKLNREHRHIDKPTDVLSFPQISTIPSDLLGSLVISKEIVDKKNEDLLDVIKHGLLHLLGYDHEKNEEKWNEVARKINCNL